MDAPDRTPAWWRVLMTLAAAGSLLLGGCFLSVPYHHYRGLVAVVAGMFFLVSAWKPPRAWRMGPP